MSLQLNYMECNILYPYSLPYLYSELLFTLVSALLTLRPNNANGLTSELASNAPLVMSTGFQSREYNGLLCLF